MIKRNSNKIGRWIAIILATLILGYPIFYFGKFFYIIYAIEKHDDEKLYKISREYGEYIALPYVDRYTPPIGKDENIPESAFWIPEDPDYGLYVLIIPIKEASSLFNVSLFYPRDIKKRKAQLIFKEGFNESNTRLSDFLSPKLPEAKVEYQTKYSNFPVVITNEIKKQKTENRNYIKYGRYIEYLEYPQGYLVFYDENNIGM